MRAGTSLPPASGMGVSHSLETPFLPPSVGERELTHLKPTCPLVSCLTALEYLSSIFRAVL